jgi:hypothetical protein
MPDTPTKAPETQEELAGLTKRVSDLEVAVNGKTQGLAQRITTLENKIAELEGKK